jgi:hypothetical protein
MVTALVIVTAALTPSTARAQSYSGNWPVNVALPPHYAHTACITLVDNGSDGAPHSGPASISGPLVGGTLPYGTFQVINNLLVVTIQSSGDSGSNAGLLFIAPALNGDIGNGVYEDVYGGEDSLSGALTFGKNGGC